jgi:hypothetical protein
MRISLKFVRSYPMVEPLLEPLFMYFDHEIFHFCVMVSVEPPRLVLLIVAFL